jgi:hypothetical protein
MNINIVLVLIALLSGQGGGFFVHEGNEYRFEILSDPNEGLWVEVEGEDPEEDFVVAKVAIREGSLFILTESNSVKLEHKYSNTWEWRKNAETSLEVYIGEYFFSVGEEEIYIIPKVRQHQSIKL